LAAEHGGFVQRGRPVRHRLWCVERQRMGYPPLTYTLKPRQRTISLEVAGTMLTDFPEIARDWNHATNATPIESVTGGSGNPRARCAS
jgi:hypothetical protein